MLIGGFVILMGVLAGVDYSRRYLLQQQLDEIRIALAAQTRATEQVESTLASRATDQRLLDEVSAREASLAQLNGTLETLRSVSQGNLNGFSEHLKNLSGASFDGIWLTDIRITNGGRSAHLQGNAVDSYMVPNFVDRLTAGWVQSEGWRFTRLSGSMTGEGGANAARGDAAPASGIVGPVAAVAGSVASEVTTTPSAASGAPTVPGTYRFVLETQ